MDFDTQAKLTIYRHVVETTRVPTVEEVAAALGETPAVIGAGFHRLRDRRVLALEADGRTIRMAPPFSGVPTQQVVRARGKSYFANCAWDALGIPACLHAPAEVHSRCDQSLEPLTLHVGPAGPDPEPCVIHFAVPAAQWWEDILHT